MATKNEIEHRYFVRPGFTGPEVSWRVQARSILDIEQGYVSFEPSAFRARIVIPRKVNAKSGETFEPYAYTTAKLGHGIQRPESEIPTSLLNARNIFSKVKGRILRKTRYVLPQEDGVWTVDEYHGELGGLYVAEFECEDVIPPPSASLPEWVYPKPITENRRFTAQSLTTASPQYLFNLRDAWVGSLVHE